MMIEPPIYLRALLRDFYNAGGKVVVREFRSREEVMRLNEPVIFNCSGLGARQLFGDEKLIPVRGQLEVLLPQPEIDYGYIATVFQKKCATLCHRVTRPEPISDETFGNFKEHGLDSSNAIFQKLHLLSEFKRTQLAQMTHYAIYCTLRQEFSANLGLI